MPEYLLEQSRERRGKNRENRHLHRAYLWNKNVDSLIRVLQGLEALRILPGRTLKECELRLEELRSAFNVGILEAMLTREQTDHWRFSRLREVLDAASRNDLVQ